MACLQRARSPNARVIRELSAENGAAARAAALNLREIHGQTAKLWISA